MMKNHLLADHLILRSPVGDAQRFTLDLATILQDKLFLLALSIATPQFYARIHAKALDERAGQTLRRYYNRFCFRATPFGLFASVTLLDWTKQAEPGHASALKVSIQADNHLDYLLGQPSDEGGELEPNPTLYRVQHDLRFVRTDTDPKTGKRQYRLQATDHTTLLQRLLGYCERGRGDRYMLQKIIHDSHCAENEAKEYLGFLRDAQVLVPKQRPRITVNADQLDDLFPLTDPSDQFDPERIPAIQQAMAERRPVVLPESHPLLNVITVSHRKSTTLRDGHRQSLLEGLYALERLSWVMQKGTLIDFAEQFNRHFEGQQVPLLHALDPETGIAYGAEEAEKNNALLETIGIQRRPVPGTSLSWTPVHQLILNAWHSSGFEREYQITLTEEQLNKLPVPEPAERSSGFGVLFRPQGDRVWIESAGGYHTNSLVGRFTPADRAIHLAAKAMAEQEQRLNPEIIFAEILHLSDLATDNVNRRNSILDWEIPLTAASSLPKDRQLRLGDLHVHIANGKVLLSSKKHRKLVMPRLSSAYNHRLNHLPLFRFLAEIPYQFGSKLRPLDLPGLFPGLSFYPRVVHKQCILSPAQWLLTHDEIRSMTGDPEYFHAYRNRVRLPHCFMLSQGDQQLVFDTRSGEQLLFFKSCISRAEQVKLLEVFTDPATQIPVREQYNAFVLPEQSLDLPFFPVVPEPLKKVKRRFMPGSEWLYLKIYTSRLGTNTLLLKLAPYLKKEFKTGTIRKWYFVRYEDHAPHIRLRLMVEGAQIGKVLTDMRAMFEGQVEQHVIREYQVDTYDRELERYGVAAFGEVEDFFHASGALILKYLAGHSDTADTDTYLFALVATKTLVDIAFTASAERLAYYHRRYSQFSTEFEGDKTYVELDKKYRALRAQIGAALSDSTYFSKRRCQRLQADCSRTFQKLIRQAKPGSIHSEQLASSLIHMHLNRLFTSESRKQEMTVFYLLAKHMKSTWSSAGR